MLLTNSVAANFFLYPNEFVRTIPSEIGAMTKLERVRLEENNFNGTLPSEVGNFRDLGTWYEAVAHAIEFIRATDFHFSRHILPLEHQRIGSDTHRIWSNDETT